jgi:hypothetical protein
MVDGTAIISYLKRLGGMGEQAYTVVKISFDGASKGFVHAAVGIINSKILSTQSREAIIPILLYKGKEDIDLLEKYLKPALQKICSLPRELYKLVMVNDLKATALISDLYENDCFCPFCTCKKNQRQNFGQKLTARVLKWKWGLQCAVGICILHLKM